MPQEQCTVKKDVLLVTLNGHSNCAQLQFLKLIVLQLQFGGPLPVALMEPAL